MKRLTTISIFMISFGLSVFSCTDPEPVVSETPADWTEVEGSYQCTSTVYTVNTNGSLSQSGSPQAMLVNAQRRLNNTGIMEFSSGGMVFQYANNARVKDMIVFDLPQQTFDEGGGNVFTSQGYSYFTVGAAKYHGTYNNANKEMRFSFLVFHSSVSGPNSVHVITGTKQ